MRRGHHRPPPHPQFRPTLPHRRPTAALSRQSLKAPMGNDLPRPFSRCGPFRPKFGWPVVPHRAAASVTKFGCSQPIIVDPKHLERCRAGAAPGCAAVAFALPSAGIARGFPARTTSLLKRATLHAFKTCGNPPKTGGNRAQTGAKNAENSRLVGNLRINQSITASACLRWEGPWDRISNFADARAPPARGPAPPRSRDFEPPPLLTCGRARVASARSSRRPF